MKPYFIFLFILAVVMGFGVNAQEGVLSSGFYDDSAPFFYFEEGYTQETDQVGYYNETRTSTLQLEFYFTGTGFTLFGLRGSSLAVWVYADDVEVFSQVFNTYLDPAGIGELFTVSDLPAGDYFAYVMDNDALFFYFDAVEIHALDIPTPMPTDTPMPTNTPNPSIYSYTIDTEEGSQVVEFHYSMTTGDVLVSTGIYALIVLLSISLVVWLWKK